MKTFRSLFYLLLAFITISLVSCDDDDDGNDIVAPSRMELLTQKEWYGMSLYANGQDITQMMADSIDLDLREWNLKLDKNGTYISTFDNMPSENGKWEFANSEQEIVFDKGTQNEDKASIARLTSTELFLDQTWQLEDEEGNPVSLAVEMRFGH
ncbi:hypothetical protein [Pontibacter mangrovi]|uniref:Lipocalin-like domain-containing protein n=1 Tax=Pontibacter mangrovi TaxID=2589816 RepID=A0A501WFX3_9BACT|nr:hypothetical protein [Pontibacter mangrovi]TPE46071.1 hypothetical protein FJM65_01625 [Pontibacter mangrovi]